MKDKKIFKKRSLSIVLVVVVVVLVVLINVVATSLSSRYPFSVDLTANKDYTINLDKDYEDFVAKIQYPVEITVCAQKDDFFNDTYGVQMVNTLSLVDANMSASSIQDITRKYAAQACYFVESFPTINRNITVTYKNPNSATDFSSVTSKYPDEELSYGDIIVSCNHPTSDGTEIERHQILKMSDIFKTESEGSAYYSSYYVNKITGSTIATEITAALYIITSDKSIKAAVIGGHDQTQYYDMTGFQTLLKKNNYEFNNVESLITADIPTDTSLIVIAAPTTDYEKSELDKIDKFLKNDGKYGKNLIYLPSIYQPVLPNLEEFLSEWGIKIYNEVSYDDSNSNYWAAQGYPQFIVAQGGETDYTKTTDDKESQYYSSCFRLMKKSFDSNQTRSAKSVIVSNNSVVGCPLDADSSWKSSSASNKGPFDLMIVSSDFAYSGDSKTDYSHVIAISGDYFLCSDALTSATYSNASVLLNVLNDVTGQKIENAITVSERVINESSFSDEIVNTASPTIIGIIFIALIPVAFIAFGIVTFVIRKRK